MDSHDNEIGSQLRDPWLDLRGMPRDVITPDKDRSVNVKPEDDPDVEQIQYKPANKPQNMISLIVCNQRVNDRREIIDLSGYTDTFGSAQQNICQFANCARLGESAGQQSVSAKIPIPSMDKSRAQLGASGN